ncbi:sensor histidine kinase [Brevibacterium sp. VCM10]|uniref:sensor histidine kinase n=1 Tax=Brevibacterium sp. VCM10 TaxID=1381751 RepID=UPI001E622214|nr:histidine kinase [Brevibacterium sp. VCM10]
MTEDRASEPRTAARMSAADRKPNRSDLWLVAALTVGSLIFAILYEGSGFWEFKAPLWAVCTLSVVVTVPLLWRRRFPNLVAWFITTLYVTAQILQMMEPGVSQIVLFTSVYAIGAFRYSQRAAFISRCLLCLAILIYVIVSAALQFQDLGDLTFVQFTAATGVTFLINTVFFGGAWLFGNRAWRQRRLLVELRAANEEVREQEQQLTRQALDLERVRIARELHDGVAHHIAGVGIHAAAARRSLEKNPAKAKESLQVIESSTRETVDELRALVYTLRETDSSADVTAATDGTAATGGQTAQKLADAATAASAKGNPSLGDLPELIESARRFDQTVEYATIGEPRPLTPITEMSIYRVIQESLTNCSRYAGAGAEVDVRLRYGSSDLEVEVSDSRPSRGSVTSGSTETRAEVKGLAKNEGLGLGIVGMRERMTALGGSLEAGPKSRGGWIVRARIPYPRSTADHLSSDTPAKATT